VRDALNAFTRDLTSPKAKSLGWKFATDEDHIQRQFKAVRFSTSMFADISSFSVWREELTIQRLSKLPCICSINGRMVTRLLFIPIFEVRSSASQSSLGEKKRYKFIILAQS